MQDKKIEETSAPKKLTIKEIARRYLHFSKVSTISSLCAHTHIYLHICTHIHTYIYTHTYTYIYTYIPGQKTGANSEASSEAFSEKADMHTYI